MTSLWLDGSATLGSDPLPHDHDVDDLVVGAGLTGLTTALLLARAGRRVAVVEARYVGAGTTGNTTAKLSLLQGTRYSQILERQSQQVAQAYVEANREGMEWLLRFCEEHEVPVQRRDAITYAATSEHLRAARGEHDAARSLGLDVAWVESFDVPFPHVGGTLLAAQAQFDPMDVLAALVASLREHGGTLHEGSRVVDVSRTGRPQAQLEDGTRVNAETVMLATGTPILDRGLYFAKLEPLRSYALAFDLPGDSIDMYLSAGSPSRSVREAVGADGSRRLLIGGSGHVVGRGGSTIAHYDELRSWTEQHFPGARESHAWSAQDYKSHDGIPYVGELPRGGGNIFLATGFDKWGMTNAVAAARSVSARILGEPPSWARTMSRRITRPSGALQIASLNAGVGVAGVSTFIDAEARSVERVPAEGEGYVGRSRGVSRTAVSTVEGVTCALSAACTHLGGTVQWNDAEKSWDCPLHGSRFAPDGTVLEGPATTPLRPAEDE
ncbi:FAD-dependent oxidoreductase [Nocardioides seonyuensis]|uniref:FAD-dependent oxidoreductase n=1 Tax=Nocardioides seonyuensis TaxID=2518371 RepID=A0A4P7IGH5_9ACTN|nr:FAD-dependent oxidoreductase [Nocardioides seonyuensis]QBX56429.1 FAD-dependent oxidoreductase [Nocardioides seonyuensis]